MPNATFHLYGDGEEKAALIRLTKELKLDSKVIFHGFTDQPVEAMKKLDCLVVPSRKESFGLVALEALAAGTPVAAFTNTGVSDFLTDNINGHLASMGNTDALANSIEAAIHCPKHWKKLSSAAIESTQEKYSLHTHIKNLEAIYESAFISQQQKETA